jgi:hypothetical protein
VALSHDRRGGHCAGCASVQTVGGGRVVRRAHRGSGWMWVSRWGVGDPPGHEGCAWVLDGQALDSLSSWHQQRASASATARAPLGCSSSPPWPQENQRAPVKGARPAQEHRVAGRSPIMREVGDGQTAATAAVVLLGCWGWGWAAVCGRTCAFHACEKHCIALALSFLTPGRAACVFLFLPCLSPPTPAHQPLHLAAHALATLRHTHTSQPAS